MMTRQTLQTTKKQADGLAMDAHRARQIIHSLVDSNLEALDKLDGGQPVIDIRKEMAERERQLTERERQVALALTDLAKLFPSDSMAGYTVHAIQEMLGAKLRNRQQWSWYTARIDEEFGEGV